MEPLLYLVHRIPYPPNKGDKIRSYHLLRFLARHYEVHLGTFVDDESDWVHEPALAEFCASRFTARLDPRRARVRSLAGLISGEALTLPYYRDEPMQRWVEQSVRERGIEKALVFSSAMAQYVAPLPQLTVVTDFVDVDSAKWTQFAEQHVWPSSLFYRFEGRRLRDAEREIAHRSAACVFVTEAEAELFTRAVPEARSKTVVAGNGVDTEYFSPSILRDSPFGAQEEAIVFTGAMDYWPNVDAVTYFAREILPRVWAVRDEVRFHVVGMNPAPTVLALANDARIKVTGRVDDVRPYLQHARAVVAPLRIARGVQNKVLEAMSMARPVVVWSAAARGIEATPGREIEVAGDAAGFADGVLRLLDANAGDAMGRAARRRILADYGWDASLRRFVDLLDAPVSRFRAQGY